MPQSLLEYRHQHGLTQKELAAEIGIAPATLLRFEKNFGNLTIRKLLSWCQRSGVDPLVIFPLERTKHFDLPKYGACRK